MFDELTDEENSLIQTARQRGFAEFFPAFPDAKAQATKTYDAAVDFMTIFNEYPED